MHASLHYQSIFIIISFDSLGSTKGLQTKEADVCSLFRSRFFWYSRMFQSNELHEAQNGVGLQENPPTKNGFSMDEALSKTSKSLTKINK